MIEIHSKHLPRVSEYKRNKSLCQDSPKEGTKLKEIYDLFVNNPGKIVTLPNSLKSKPGQDLLQLKNFYGLDIRLFKKSSTKRGPSLYFLASYWDGKQYVDLTQPEDT